MLSVKKCPKVSYHGETFQPHNDIMMSFAFCAYQTHFRRQPNFYRVVQHRKTQSHAKNASLSCLTSLTIIVRGSFKFCLKEKFRQRRNNNENRRWVLDRRKLTCESFENSNALEALEVVDENIGNPEVGQELKADRVPGILIIRLKLSRISLWRLL